MIDAHTTCPSAESSNFGRAASQQTPAVSGSQGSHAWTFGAAPRRTIIIRLARPAGLDGISRLHHSAHAVRIWLCASFDWPTALCCTAGAAALASKSTLPARPTIRSHGHRHAQAVRPPISGAIRAQRAALPARLVNTSRHAVILYRNHPLIPSPNPVPTRTFAGSSLSEHC